MPIIAQEEVVSKADREGGTSCTETTMIGPTEVRQTIAGWLARVRARAEREHEISRSTLTPHYAAASIGQFPYVALPDCGAIVVQRKCGLGC
jgi:hypothetical protein